MTPEQKKEIDMMNYYQLLKLWRFGSDDPEYFQGLRGRYFSEVMSMKRKDIGESAAVSISKRIGW